MTEQKLPNNCLLKKTKDLLDIQLFQDTLNKFQISGKCFLIVDTRGSFFLNNFYTFTEVISKGIFSIDLIYKKRKPYKTFSAIYLVSGKRAILEKIIKEDFDKKDRLYKYCHLFIIDEITNDLFDYLAQYDFLKYLKSLKQVSIKYVTLDKNLFSFGNDINFNSIYNLFESSNEIDNLNISRVYNICRALNVYPNIVYFSPDKKCKLLAEKVNAELKKHFAKKVKEGILLITSRLMDFTAPVQFDTLYQHLLLEEFKDSNTQCLNKINLGKNKNNKEQYFILDYKDEYYNKYKYRQFFEVMNLVDEDVKEFKNSEIGKAKANLENEVVAAAKHFGKYKSTYQLLEKHVNLSIKIRDKQNERKIMDLMNTQKSIISQMNDRGKKLSESDINSLIKNNKFEKSDLKRLLCLIKYHYPGIDLGNNYNNFSVSEKKIIEFFNRDKNLIDSGKLEELNNSIIEYRKDTNYNTKEENENKNDNRFVYGRESKLTTLCDMSSKNKLPEDLFTFVEKPENLKMQKKQIKTQFDNYKNNEEEDNKKYLILFNIGGLSNYEVSSLERGDYLGQYNMNLVLGGNKIYNCKEYLNEIQDYINGKNSIYKKEESEEIKNYESKDSKIDINEISFNEKGSSEKLKKNKKNYKKDETFEDEEDMK